MEKFLADTHAIVWYIENHANLGKKAKAILNKMTDGSAVICLSIASLLEMDYLVYRKKIYKDIPDVIGERARSPKSALQIIDIDRSIYEAFQKVPVSIIPELPDRIIAATALHLSCPLLTKDSKIAKWKEIETVW